ncbi:TetR/AcrR family transcriptional regulator [Streptoalloteichus hindustanus]|uniref:Transcriptional regulator, TetR family n=1 Tax=Streptoalloteichus hindustanus TaxID=2017 RepID=A0A1M5P0R5_STRHI|nr:TetR/AcrR family transcriptional regulator [Streptoalloteichus hindustanus]SHG95019.1 transcriptional regulator, TetR family [Streptoalloteichus hindustanus]
MPAAHARSRRERPAKPALTRDGIITTALRVLRDEGLQRVTMRRLAQELDTGPASLYVYVANTAELHAAVLDELLGEVDLSPARGAGEWRERVEAVLASYGRVLHEYPSLARAAVVARPSGPNYLNLLDALLALLKEGGVPDDQAAWGVDVLLLVATADAAEHSTHPRTPHSENEWNALADALRNASPTDHPHLAGHAAQLLSGTPELRQAWTLRVLLDGILRTPLPDAAQSSTP